MAQAPQNPYQGVQGVRTAWANLAHWVSVTLPEQWALLQEIIDYVGGQGAPSGPPIPSGPSLGGASAWPRSAYEYPYIEGVNGIAIANHAAQWRYQWNQGNTVTIGSPGSWDGHPDIHTITAVAQNYDVMISASGVTVWPGGQGIPNVPGGILWEAGREVIW